ncbi:MAG: ParB/RepB/Spo0J family partition protein [Acidobacteriota bacterium]
MKRKALGRGLDSLIPVHKEGVPTEDNLRMIDVDLIKPGKHQPREEFNGDELQELAGSIKEHGIIQPVILKKYGEKFQLIAGERRWRAAQLSGLLKVPSIVMDVADDHLLEISLVENIQRKELNPIEEANAYRTMLERLELTQDEIAKRVGKKRSSVANYLRLLKLPEKVQNLLKRGILTMGHVKALSTIEREEDQIKLAQRIATETLSVRQVESLALRWKSKKPKMPQNIDPNIMAAEKELQKVLGTKVRIIKRRRGGRIEIRFYSDEELDRLYNFFIQG